MKIIDTTTYFEEKLMMEIRFNILDSFVDKFVVCESKYSHSGKEKKINFNIDNYPQFKNKIIHLIVDKEPNNLISKKDLSTAEKRYNSVIRIKHQRNFIMNILDQFSSEDFIIHSDNDEIPNLEKFDLLNSKNKFIIFNQKIFYYKLNLMLPSLNWYGSKACKLKNIRDIDNLRAIKNKKYPFFRFDTLFSKIKHQSVKIIKEGGWHFSNLKEVSELEKKYLNDENHSEYEAQGFTLERIRNNIKNRVIDYNHGAKKNSKERFNQTKLDVTKTELLPKYLQNNLDKYEEWIV
jgi:beta-1,4-mannosyl-glycoprotein beta-1,4-N-acetylglucosaminyltransferase